MNEKGCVSVNFVDYLMGWVKGTIAVGGGESRYTFRGLTLKCKC